MLDNNGTYVISQGNGPSGQVETSPEMLFVHRVHLVMIVHKLSTANALFKCAKNAENLDI
jgi:hypothetical protein